MKMSRCLSTSTLLMLSLEAALLAAAIDMGTIRLPSDTQAAAARPWKCCDRAVCTKSIPPICQCFDEVEQCAATCKDCAASTSNPYRLVCQDSYRAYTDRNPGPVCTPR
ncbi:unnamed protein product [Alopecurus aequalis]